MSELRQDSITGISVVVAPDRAHRPHITGPDTTHCPFCPGHETMTPPELTRIGPGAPDTEGWRVRVVPNLYPAVTEATRGLPGRHEVIVLSPDHQRGFGQLDDAGVVDVFTALQERAVAHAAAGRTHVVPFMNFGAASGASIDHPHAQLVALDIVPPVTRAMLRRAEDSDVDLVLAQFHHARRAELTVLERPGAAAWCPPASSHPFEFVVAPMAAETRFNRADPDAVAAVAIATRDVYVALQALVGEASTTTVIESAPVDPAFEAAIGFRWHVRVLPRLSVQGGFEYGTGYLANALSAEDAARGLRHGLG
jgi:UDPglucose--hexose-1-phosphate uridylyltransferase